MKKLIIFILILTINIFLSDLSADEIHLKGGLVIKCKIILVTPDFIEFDPEGSRNLDIIPRNQVTEIIYNDGTKIKLK